PGGFEGGVGNAFSGFAYCRLRRTADDLRDRVSIGVVYLPMSESGVWCRKRLRRPARRVFRVALLPPLLGPVALHLGDVQYLLPARAGAIVEPDVGEDVGLVPVG